MGQGGQGGWGESAIKENRVGKLDGKVACDSFTLRSSAEVKADVTTGGIVIESGAAMEGRFLKRG